VHTDRSLYPAGAMSPAEHANFVAARVVGHATLFLKVNPDAALLASNAKSAMLELIPCSDDLKAKAILDASRLLVVAMLGTSHADGDEVRQDRWMQIMAAMIELVRHESTELKRTGAQRS
jgi:hypothetical protein